LSYFHPNTINLSDPVMILTGPNMGGKSTLLRQACLVVIMAQAGFAVPCSSARFSPVDRVFTRIGANDRMLAGQSTFQVELEETSSILRNATSRSLVLLDELGRGTSTFDGIAIAFSVIKHLAALRTRTLFSTHYHSLATECSAWPGVSLKHMHCLAEKGALVLLYELREGGCERSFAYNVATLAGIPSSITSEASRISERMEGEALANQRAAEVTAVFAQKRSLLGL